MIKSLLLCIFLLINIFTFSAYGNSSTEETEDFRTSKQQKEPKSMYDTMIMESSKARSQRRNLLGLLHAIQHTKVSQKTKTGKGGGVNDVKSTHKGKNSAISTYSIKSSSLFIAALKHLIPGFLLLGCFF